jgi:hypothetical protein
MAILKTESDIYMSLGLWKYATLKKCTSISLKPGAHWSYYELSWASLVTVDISKFPQCALAFWAISATRDACHHSGAIGTEYSTCWIISVTNEHFLHVCALEKLSPFIVDRFILKFALCLQYQFALMPRMSYLRDNNKHRVLNCNGI